MRVLAPEVARSDAARKYSGFYERFMNGRGIDIGFRGETQTAAPVVKNALGIDTDMPGYDGIHIKWPDESLDFVFSSHCFEHLSRPDLNLKEWYRLTKLGGFIIIIVPHQHLYEKKMTLPSLWNEDHKCFFTPATLLKLIEDNLQPNSYRIVSMRDNDVDYDYDIGPDRHCSGACEIELVIKKIKKPDWEIK